MELLSAWDERLARTPPPKPEARRLGFALSKSPTYYAQQTTYVDTVEAAVALAEFVQQRPLAHIGFDTEFRYDNPGVVVDRGRTTHDPRSIHPLLLSLSLAEPEGEHSGELYNFVVDLRKAELWPALRAVFHLP